jgi:hypothetical protein
MKPPTVRAPALSKGRYSPNRLAHAAGPSLIKNASSHADPNPQKRTEPHLRRTAREQTVKVAASGRHAGATIFWHLSEKPGNAWVFSAWFGTTFSRQQSAFVLK